MRPAAATFTYAQVERALARVHAVAPEARGAFKARIKKLQAQKIVPASPGKGQRILYRPEDVYLWAYCLELSEFGIDPKIVRRIIESTWERESGWSVSAKMCADDAEGSVFVFDPNVLSGWYALDGEQYGAFTSNVISESALTANYLKRLGFFRGGFIYLTELRKKVDRELAAGH